MERNVLVVVVPPLEEMIPQGERRVEVREVETSGSRKQSKRGLKKERLLRRGKEDERNERER